MHLGFLVFAFYMYTRIGGEKAAKEKESRNCDLLILKENAYKELWTFKENSYKWIFLHKIAHCV